MSVGSGELLRLLSGRLPTADGLDVIRTRRLRALVRSAYDHVPYYRALFERAGLLPDDIRRVEDLRHVPVSTPDQLRSAGTDAVARGADRTTGRTMLTSGSTGQPRAIFRTPAEDRLRRATEFRSMRRAGIGPRDVVATIGPFQTMGPAPLARLGLYRVEHIPLHLPIERQIDRLRRIQPTVLWMYPTALRALLQQCGSLAAIGRPRLLVHSAEPLDDLLRDQACAGLSIATRNFYGSAEAGRIAWECAARDRLHVNADCVILELADDGDVAGAGRSVVITNLNSHAMPFIRYRLGDRCEFVGRPCSCGVPLPLITAPRGREWDVIQLPSGKLLSPFGIAAFLRRVEGLRRYRVVQTHLDRLVVMLQFDAPRDVVLTRPVREQIEAYVSERMAIEIAHVDAMPETGLKSRTFVSELALPPRRP